MNLMDLFVRIGVDDQASGKIDDIADKFESTLTTAVMTATAALAALGTMSISNYADYEQLTGGVETLFKDSAGTVMEFAENAYKTAGLSANKYMETVTSFSASLLQSLGGDTKKAAQYANQAIIDMSDNANKMGSSMEMIQNAYQGFAKQNYTMLDNLKLGYGGTKTEMERLLKDADALSESFNLQTDEAEELVYSYADIVDAIHIIQTEMGITGTTAQEAEKTISGSAAAMKAAFGNFLTELTKQNGDVAGSFEELKKSVSTFVDNLTPRIWAFIDALGPIGPLLIGISTALVTFKSAMLISKLIDTATKSFIAYTAANEGATVAQWLLNGAMEANPIVLIVTLISGLVAAIITLWNTNEDFKNALIAAWNFIKDEAVYVFGAVCDFFTKTIPESFDTVVEWFENLGDWFYEIGKNMIEGLWEGIEDAASDLWEGIKDVGGAIVDGFKWVFGIKSPSRVFKKEIGKNLILGIGAGFDEEMPKLRKKIDNGIGDLAGDIGGDLNTNISANMAYGSIDAAVGAGMTSINGVEINIYADQAGDSAESIADAVAIALQDLLDRRSAVYA